MSTLGKILVLLYILLCIAYFVYIFPIVKVTNYSTITAIVMLPVSFYIFKSIFHRVMKVIFHREMDK